MTTKYIWITFLILYSLSASPSLCEDAEVVFESAKENKKPGGGTEGTNNTYYKDLTHFIGGINGWDFSGMWAKYDLSSLDENARPIPINPAKPDQSVFICHTSTLPGTLEKMFPALEKVNLTLSYYLSSRDMDIAMLGNVKIGGKTEEIFSFSEPSDTHEHNDTWVTQHFHLSDITKEGNFTLQFVLRSFEEETTRTLTDVWATDEIIIEGFKVTSLPIVGTGEPLPGGNVTTPKPDMNSTNPAIATNVTQGTNFTNVGENVTTIASNVTFHSNQTVDGNNGTNNGTNGANNGTHTEPTNVVGPTSSFSEHVNKLAGVAEAIWNAFYVFLALFCACLIALVGLIVRGRCNSDAGTMTTPRPLSPPTTPGPPPTASTRSTITQGTTPMQYERSV